MSFSLVYAVYRAFYRLTDPFRHLYLFGAHIFARRRKQGTPASPEIFFDDPRLRMTVSGRLAVRILLGVGSLLFVVLTATLVLSDIPRLFWIGVFCALILLDRAVHFGEPDRSLEELRLHNKAVVHPPALKSVGVNLANYLEPKTFHLLERAYDRSVVLHRHLTLEVIRELLGSAEVQEMLQRLDVELDEFKQKTEELARHAGDPKTSHDTRRNEIATLVRRGYEAAESNSHARISAGDVFAGIARSEEEFPSRLFEAFELRADDLERAVIFGVLGRGGGFFRRLFLSHVFDLKRLEKFGASDPVRILVFKAVELEAHHKATVSFVAIKTAAWVAENYAHDKLPSSLALELMRKAFVSAEERGDARVEPDHVIATAEEDLKTSVRAPVHRN